MDELKVPVHKIIACMSSFRLETNKALKHQYAIHLQNPYYAATAIYQLIESPETETFMQFHVQSALIFKDHSKCNKISALTQKWEVVNTLQ